MSLGWIIMNNCFTNFFLKDIRWCQKVSGRFKALVFRIPPQTSTVSTSRNGCVVLQKSTINFSLSNRDSDVEIMCESGYSIANKECGEGSAHSTLYIRTDTLDEGSKCICFSSVKVKNTIWYIFFSEGGVIILCIDSTLALLCRFCRYLPVTK